MKKLLVLLLILAMLFSFVGCSKTADKIRIGTAGAGGTYEEVGKSISSVFKDNGIESELKNTAGSAANLRLLSEGYFDLAIAQEDIANDAYNGTGTFEKIGAYKGYSAVAEIHTDRANIEKVDEEEQEIEYDNLAMPEIHLPHHEENKNN